VGSEGVPRAYRGRNRGLSGPKACASGAKRPLKRGRRALVPLINGARTRGRETRLRGIRVGESAGNRSPSGTTRRIHKVASGVSSVATTSDVSLRLALARALTCA
jgi:hypothetical protein